MLLIVEELETQATLWYVYAPVRGAIRTLLTLEVEATILNNYGEPVLLPSTIDYRLSTDGSGTSRINCPAHVPYYYYSPTLLFGSLRPSVISQKSERELL